MAVTTALILVSPQDLEPFCIKANSSDFTSGAVLSQQLPGEDKWHPVEIWTDHKNLEYFMMAKKLNRRQACWSLYLARFDFKLIYHPGCSMGKPDALSRRPDHGKETSDNKDIVLLQPELIAVRALEGLHLEGPERDMLKEIHQGNQRGDQKEPIAKIARKL